tara:strand:- start:8554 stop:8835 length:282 start_codon:yes stop_codon:yes gene_type:complete
LELGLCSFPALAEQGVWDAMRATLIDLELTDDWQPPSHCRTFGGNFHRSVQTVRYSGTCRQGPFARTVRSDRSIGASAPDKRCQWEAPEADRE